MKAALQFSGGKDSLALLWYMEALWPYIDVICVDTGDMYPSTAARIAFFEKIVPNFHRIKTDAKAHRKIHGDPNGATWMNCCASNVYAPMHQYLYDGGYRQVIRGTKATDPHVHLAFPGDVLDGVLYTFPLWHWTDRDVMEYLGARLPIEYQLGAVGMPDCASCTAVEMCGGTTKAIWDRVVMHDGQTALDLH